MNNITRFVLASVMLAFLAFSVYVTRDKTPASSVTQSSLTPVALQAGVVPPDRPSGAGQAPEAGVNLGGYANSDFPELPAARQARVMQDIHHSGISWIRIDVSFTSEEARKGDFSWTVDDEVEAATQAGLRVDAVLDYPPTWARTSAGTPNPTDFAQFSNSAASHLERLGVTTFEVYNEPNMTAYWGGAVSAHDYTVLLGDAYRAIHSVGSDLTVVAAGLAQTETSGTQQVDPLTYLTQMYAAGAAGHFDALADHPYTFPDDPDPSESGSGFANLAAMRQLMVKHGDSSKKMWITEYGAPTADAGSFQVTQSQQATEIDDTFSYLDDKSWSGPIFLFDWQDDTGDGSFGITTSQGAAKDAYTSLVHLLSHR